MLAPERQTPRPRPPAQIRRSPPKRALLSSDSAPPPPYAFEFPSLDEDALAEMTDPVPKMMGIEGDPALDIPLITEEDVNTKSKAELTDLFLQAEKIIKAREQELSVAANLGKTLLETNEALKLRHDALLSRLPAMQSPTTPNSTIKPLRNDHLATDDEDASSSFALSRIRSRTSSIISSVQEGSPIDSRSNSIVGVNPSPRRGHVRRLSASPSALLALSETNAELIAELTRLHNTTDVAQIEGAQRLRKLEREIGGLKAELEATQRTNAELEEKVREKVDEERKREREERLRRLRGGDDPDSDATSDSPIRDFAPQGGGVQKWDSIPVTPRIKRVMSPSLLPADSEPEESDGETRSMSAVSAVSSRSASHITIMDKAESAVVAQLYRKVVELQEANAELTARNRVTKKQLARAEQEALEIKNLYEAIGEELAADQGEQDNAPTIVLRGSGSKPSTKSSTWSLRMRGDPFLDDKRRGKHGSYGSLGSKVLYHGVRAHKSRARLSDTLFTPPVPATSRGDADKTPPSVVLFPSSPSSKPKLRPKLKGKVKSPTNQMPLLSPVASPTLHRSFSGGSGSSVSSRTSIASSFLGPSVGRRMRGRRSLGSELGSEFGEDWGDAPPSMHDSLFDDGSVRAMSESETETRAYAADAEEDPALAALRDALTPPLAGRLLERDEHILPVGSLQASPGDAFHLVAHAVTARPTRWLDADDHRPRGAGPRPVLTYEPAGEDPWETTRYPDIDPTAAAEEEEEGRTSIRMRRRDRALGRMVSMAHSRSASSSALVSSTQQLATLGCPPRGGLVESIKRTSADFLVELWIFLQFVVVICIFLYTMSRRGPREVLGAPPRRT